MMKPHVSSPAFLLAEVANCAGRSCAEVCDGATKHLALPGRAASVSQIS